MFKKPILGGVMLVLGSLLMIEGFAIEAPTAQNSNSSTTVQNSNSTPNMNRGRRTSRRRRRRGRRGRRG
jgi:hypothetical protein